MAASNTYTFDDTTQGPHRPTKADMGGAEVVNRGNVDKSGSSIYAEMVNQTTLQALGAGRTTFLFMVTVNSAGTPAVVALSQPGTIVTIPDVLLVDNGVGDITVRILKTKIPALGCDAAVRAGSGDTVRSVTHVYSSTSTHHEWRVRLRDSAGAAVDGRFTLEVM